MTVVIVEPAQSSSAALIPVALEEGLNVIIISSTSPQYQDIPIKTVIQADTQSSDAIYDAIHNHNIKDIQAIIPGNEQVVESVAEVSRRIGLRAIQASTQHWMRNKFAMRERLSSCGLVMPRYRYITNFNELEIAAKAVGFPAVLKPINGSGSVCVKKVNNWQELVSCYLDFQDTPQTYRGKILGHQLILESYFNGPEYSIEGYIQNQQAIIVSVTDKILGQEPWFVEMGHVVEADLTSAERAEIETYIKKVVHHLQLDLGVFHGELRLTEQGPMLIEIAARLGGNYICHLVEKVKQFSLPKAMLLSYLGRENEIIYNCSTQNIYAGILFFTNQQQDFSSTLKECLLAHQGVEAVIFYSNKVGASDNFQDARCYAGYIMFTISTKDCYKTFLEQIENICNKNLLTLGLNRRNHHRINNISHCATPT